MAFFCTGGGELLYRFRPEKRQDFDRGHTAINAAAANWRQGNIWRSIDVLAMAKLDELINDHEQLAIDQSKEMIQANLLRNQRTLLAMGYEVQDVVDWGRAVMQTEQISMYKIIEATRAQALDALLTSGLKKYYESGIATARVGQAVLNAVNIVFGNQ
jgi:hypothetical protein